MMLTESSSSSGTDIEHSSLANETKVMAAPKKIVEEEKMEQGQVNGKSTRFASKLPVAPWWGSCFLFSSVSVHF